ncbi:MAG TPA: YbhB/YbcL family Raf kinase inhibitor-like protein [Candidatus Binatia bacterium]|nr:YbhB/YbcL family Raf kinase inhibitor-like protein [Candidatus Binatia bacterium]
MLIFTKRGLTYFLLIDAVLLATALTFLMVKNDAKPLGLEDFGSGKMRLTSPAFAQNGPIPAKYTCQGDNVSPPLEVAGVPENAKSLALIMDDPDAPIGTFTHWVVWNLPPRAAFKEGAAPAGAIEGQNGAGKPGYTGPCPPTGTHRYFFKLYALDEAPVLPPSTNAKALEAAMEGKIVERAALVGIYRKK